MPEVLTLYPLAHHLQLSPTWLRDQALAGRIPHLRAGPRLLFSVPAVIAALSRIVAEESQTLARAEVAHATT